jgi:hypothetical protein
VGVGVGMGVGVSTLLQAQDRTLENVAVQLPCWFYPSIDLRDEVAN